MKNIYLTFVLIMLQVNAWGQCESSPADVLKVITKRLGRTQKRCIIDSTYNATLLAQYLCYESILDTKEKLQIVFSEYSFEIHRGVVGEGVKTGKLYPQYAGYSLWVWKKISTPNSSLEDLIEAMKIIIHGIHEEKESLDVVKHRGFSIE